LLAIEQAFHEAADALADARAPGLITAIDRALLVGGGGSVGGGLLSGSGIQAESKSQAGKEESPRRRVEGVGENRFHLFNFNDC
jgi:hypothetical protein